MSELLQAIEHMEAGGMKPAAILAAIKAMEAARADRLEQRRASDRTRQQKRRDKTKDASRDADTSHVTSRDDNSGHVTSRESRVTVCDTSPPFPPPFSPHTPQKPPPISPPPGDDAVSRVVSFDAPPPWTGAELDGLKRICLEAAGSAVNLTASGIHSLAGITHLLRPRCGGPPCEIEDVRNGIAAAAASLTARKAKPVSSWTYFTKPILEARDMRLTPIPEVEIIDEHPARRSGNPATAHARRGAGARSGREHSGGSLFAAAVRLQHRAEDEDRVPGEWIVEGGDHGGGGGDF